MRYECDYYEILHGVLHTTSKHELVNVLIKFVAMYKDISSLGKYECCTRASRQLLIVTALPDCVQGVRMSV